MSLSQSHSYGVKPILNGEHLLREHSLGYSSNLVGSLLGELLLCRPSWKYSSNCDEAIFGIQKASFNMFWEYSPSSANIASDW